MVWIKKRTGRPARKLRYLQQTWRVLGRAKGEGEKEESLREGNGDYQSWTLVLKIPIPVKVSGLADEDICFEYVVEW